MSDEHIRIRGVVCAVTDCITCGVVFTVPLAAYEHQREKGGYHYCPNGHPQGWSVDGSEIGRVRRERDRLAQQIAQKDDEIRHTRQRWNEAELALEKEKATRTRVERRVHNGVCPDCNRSFANLQRHVATKHKAAALVA